MRKLSDSNSAYCIFTELASGIYQCIKNRHGLRGSYFTSNEIVSKLRCEERIAVVDREDNILVCNFKMSNTDYDIYKTDTAYDIN